MDVGKYRWKISSEGAIYADDGFHNKGRLLILRRFGYSDGFYVDVHPWHLEGTVNEPITGDDVQKIMDMICEKVEQRYSVFAKFKMV